MANGCAHHLGKVAKLKDDTDLLVDQIRTISNRRLMADKPLAELSRAHIKRGEQALGGLTGASSNCLELEAADE